MKFKLISPCQNCPFRNNINFFLHRDRRQEIADALLHDQTFACHKTVDYTDADNWDEQGGYKPTEGEHHCAGALIVLKRSGHLWDNFLFRLAAMSKMFDPDQLNMNAPVFDSLDLFVEVEDQR